MSDLTTVSRAQGRGFVITRVFTAPPERVFDAWTRPERVAAWFGPRGLTTPLERLSMDVRPGGRWTLTMVADDGGAEYPVTFEYLEVQPPDRLVLTTEALDEDGTPRRARVTVSLRPAPEGTRMTFVVEGLPASEDDAALEEGWDSSFDCLAEALAATA